MVERSTEYKKMGEELIKRVPELQYIKEGKIKIAWLESTQKKMSNRKVVFADCRKIDEWMQVFCKYDFVITVYSDNCMGLTNNQMQIVLWHELLHVGIDAESLNPIYIVNPHDIEDFRSIVDRFGLDWAEPGAEPPSVWEVVENERNAEIESIKGEENKRGHSEGIWAQRRNQIRSIKTTCQDNEGDGTVGCEYASDRPRKSKIKTQWD